MEDETTFKPPARPGGAPRGIWAGFGRREGCLVPRALRFKSVNVARTWLTTFILTHTMCFRLPLSKLLQSGSVPGQKVGKHWRFSRAAIDNWLGNGATKVPTDRRTQERSLGRRNGR